MHAHARLPPNTRARFYLRARYHAHALLRGALLLHGALGAGALGAGALGAGALGAGALGCGHATPPVASTRGRADAAHREPSRGTSTAIVGEYDVRYDGNGELRVEARLAGGTDALGVESGAERFVEDFEVAPAADPPRWARGPRNGRSFVAAACRKGPCLVRYRYRLRDAAKALDDLDIASEEGAAIEAPPSTWLLTPAPAALGGEARVRFRVATSSKTSFATGVAPSREAEGAWDIALRDLWTAPYTVFGPLRAFAIDAAGARIDVRIVQGKLTVTDDQIVGWVTDAARAITTYFGRFPMPEVLLILVPSSGRWVGEGKTLCGGGGAIFMRVGESAPLQALREDWVLVHEMTHLAFPSVPREHDWAEEGLATYVEPFARARVGTLSVEEAWRGLLDGLPNGLPRPGDAGLDRTPTWGRTYWGGALFYLLADVDIRRRSGNRLGLEHALRGILAAGGSNAHRWALEDAFTEGDKALGVPALTERHAAMGTAPHPVDLEALWRDLGIVRTRSGVRFDDAAPLAAIRRAITSIATP